VKRGSQRAFWFRRWENCVGIGLSAPTKGYNKEGRIKGVERDHRVKKIWGRVPSAAASRIERGVQKRNELSRERS